MQKKGGKKEISHTLHFHTVPTCEIFHYVTEICHLDHYRVVLRNILPEKQTKEFYIQQLL